MFWPSSSSALVLNVAWVCLEMWYRAAMNKDVNMYQTDMRSTVFVGRCNALHLAC